MHGIVLCGCRHRLGAALAVFAAVASGAHVRGQAQPDWMQARVLRPSTMAYDVVRQRVVLFGGSSYYGATSETWEWDGSNWTQRSPATNPGARWRHAMAYDAVRQRVVMFGGVPGPVAYTWEWDGVDWTRRAPVTSPMARTDHAMAYDIARQRVVLFGGWDNSSNSFADTWEWNGSEWTQQSRASGPGALANHAMAYDLARQRVVLFGPDGETWLYGPLAPASSLPFGTACTGSNGLPVLTSNTPYLGNPAFALDLLSACPASPCVFGLSAGTQTLPIGPCTLYLMDPIFPLFAVTNWAGFAETAKFALPLDITLRGVGLYAQAFVADPQGPVLGLAFSAGLRLVLGD